MRRTRPGVTVTKAVVRAGRAKKTVTGSKLARPIRLARLPKRKTNVRLELTLADGRVLKTSKTYRRCGR